MAKVRARADNGNLFLDFYYREKRCREQTALADTTENRKKVQALLNRIEKEIARGVFDYAATFPGSPRAKAFALDDMRSRTPVSAAIKASLPTSATPLLADFSDVWFNEMTPQWRRSHRSCVRDVLDKHILPMFGSRPVASIQKADVLSFRAHLAKLPGRKAETLTPGRVNKVMCFLRQILNEAADRFEFTPAFRKVKPLKMKKSDVQPFSMDEVQRILDTIRVDYRNYMTTRFFTGMRTGEINGLKWKYVDFERNLILVRETLVEGEAEEGTKTESSQRDIPMLPMVRAAIDAQFKARDPECPWVFATRSGGPIDGHNFTNRVWYPLLRFLELEKRRPYQTRHTAATLMLAAGESPEWIAMVLGHANTSMLFRVYSRFVPNLTRQDGQAFVGLVNRANAVPVPQASADDALLSKLKSLAPDELKKLLAMTETN
jgi:integrase